MYHNSSICHCDSDLGGVKSWPLLFWEQTCGSVTCQSFFLSFVIPAMDIEWFT